MLLVHFSTVDPIPIDDGGLTPGAPAEDGPQGPPTTTTATPCQDHSVTVDLTVTSAGVAMFEVEPVDGPENMNIQVSLQHWGMSLQKQSRMIMLSSYFNMIMALFLTHRQNKPSAQLPQPTRSQTGKWEEFEIWTPISPGELIRQSPYCPGQGHSQQEVLSAHCSR